MRGLSSPTVKHRLANVWRVWYAFLSLIPERRIAGFHAVLRIC